jgi:hypothetical protein
MSNTVFERYGRSIVPARSPLNEDEALRLVVGRRHFRSRGAGAYVLRGGDRRLGLVPQ